MPDQNSGITQDRLNDLLGLLGAGAAGAASKALFLTPPQYRRLQQFSPPQPMHPAVWENLPQNTRNILNRPTSESSRNWQKSIDQDVMHNVDRLHNYRPDNPDLFKHTAWSISPTMGPVREIPDTGARMVPSMWPGKYWLRHPTAEIHDLFGLNPIVENPAWTHQQGNFDPLTSTITLGEGAPTRLALHEVGHNAHTNSGLISLDPLGSGAPGAQARYRSPSSWGLRDVDVLANSATSDVDPHIAKALIERALNRNDRSAMDQYSKWLTYLKAADETENRNIENRFQNPELYLQNPHATQDWPSNQLIYEHLRYAPPK